jgi:DUF438 domain-containing protein|uniref:Uncharacterized protein n=1 Tax=uncultured bacterium contig00085 TaxID=1181558 RepID=A0A806JZ35_9BACT|nr:hypothetical protein [uncultured bacterium contig00085]
MGVSTYKVTNSVADIIKDRDAKKAPASVSASFDKIFKGVATYKMTSSVEDIIKDNEAKKASQAKS